MAGQAPYSVRVSADVAQQLADQGGALLVLDLPEGSYFGIDHMAFRCGPKFRGVKMLPPGPHFACYSVPGSESHGGGMGPVTGFFLHIASVASGAASDANVIVRRYDAAEELLLELPEEEAQRYALGVRRYDFDWGLAPYNLHAWQQWRELTSCLDPWVIEALQPLGGTICSAAEADAELDEQGAGAVRHAPTAAEARLKKQLLEGRAARRGSRTAAAAMELEVAAEAGTARGGSGAGCGGGPAAASEGAAVTAAAATAAINRPTLGREGLTAEAATADLCRPAPAPAPVPTSGGRCFYSELSRLVKEAGMSPAQLTAANLDRTAQLQRLATSRYLPLCGGPGHGQARVSSSGGRW